MRRMGCRVGPAALAIALFALLFAVPQALGDTTDIIEPQFSPPNAKNSGFQAGTCTANFLDPPPPPTEYCSEETPSLFYQAAAGHPPVAFTQYIIQHAPFTPLPSPPFPPGSVAAPIKEPILDRSIKALQVDIPPGFTVNPESTPRCPLTQFVNVTPEGIIPACDEATAVGLEEVTLVTNAENVNVPGLGVIPTKGFVIPPTPGISKVPVFNLEPKDGEPALFGFVVARQRVIYIEGDVAWESDFHQSFQIQPPEPAIPGLSTLISRLVNFGQDAGNFKVVSGAYAEENGEPKPQPTGSGDGTFLTLPTTCFDPDQLPALYSTWFRAESYGDPNPTFPAGSTPVEAKLPPGERPEGCEKVPFEPSLETGLSTNAVDSPAAATVTVRLPFNPTKEGGEVREDGQGGWEGVSQSHVRSARVTLPEGLGLNPAAVNTGLGSCTDAQFGKGTRNTSNSCPPSSQIGTVAVETPPLPPGALTGNVYLGQQLSRDPASGKEFRIFVEAKSLRYGIVARLIGDVVANPETGQLTTVFDEPPKVTPFAGTLPHGLPQVPFESIRLSLDEAKRLLTSPPTCGPNGTTSLMEPWAREGQLVSTPPTSFTLSAAPGGGACPKTLGERPFDPTFSAGPKTTKAGAFTPFELHLTRPDGAQEFRQVNVKLPPGMVAQLRNLDYCSNKAIAKASEEAGSATLDNSPPPCPDRSFLGTSTVAAGSGPDPYVTQGNVYLAGPYKGAPVSLVFMTPAVAGPYDLGTVVVRTALQVDPETVRVTAVSDTIPYVFGGVKLGIRKIDISIYRKPFTLNPTNCKSSQIAAEIAGGGSNPLSSAAWSKVDRASKFRAKKCGALKFKPRFDARIFGGKRQTQRAANPKFRAILSGHYGDANIKRASFVLPRSTILDQSHIRTICTRVQLAADDCPKAAIYGYARARSPLLSDVVKGPVYLTSSNHQLPDLLLDLRGQIDVQLRGVISSTGGRLKTVFPKVPDVPVRKFILAMHGGSRGLLVNSTNLCASNNRLGNLNLKAQNGKQVKRRTPIHIAACN